MHIVLSRDGLDFVNFECLWPLLQLLKPVFLIFRQQILFGVIQDPFGSLRLLKLVIGLNQLLDCVLRGVVKFLLPVI